MLFSTGKLNFFYCPCKQYNIERNDLKVRKKLTAYFSDSEKAGGAAFDISQMLGEGSEIIIGSGQSEKLRVFDRCTLFAFLGAAGGAVLGIVLAIAGLSGPGAAISPFTGLLCGGVIGAICGCIIDLTNYELFPVCSHLTISLNSDKCTSAVRQLRKKGAMEIFIQS